MNNENVQSEIISSFVRNGKVYMIIELDMASFLKNNQTQPFMSGIPSPDDFRFEFEIQGDQVCIVLYYEDKEKWRQCFKIDCITYDKIPLSSEGPVEIYLKDISVCPEGEGARVKLKLAVKAPIIGEKIILSIDRRVP